MEEQNQASPELGDKKAAEELYGIFEKYLKSEAENTYFMVKEHPKGKKALDSYCQKVCDCIRNFIVDDIAPKINIVTEEELDRAMSGFWVCRSEKKKIVREKS